MDEDIARILNVASGEALQCTLMLSALIAKLVQKGVLTSQEVVDLADNALLVLEKYRPAVRGGPGAIDYARSRLEATISKYSSNQGSGLSD